MIRGYESLKSNFQPLHQEVHAKKIQTHILYFTITFCTKTSQPLHSVFQLRSALKPHDNYTLHHNLPTITFCSKTSPQLHSVINSPDNYNLH